MENNRTSLMIIFFVSILFLLSGFLTLYIYKYIKDSFYINMTYFLFFVGFLSMIFSAFNLSVINKMNRNANNNSTSTNIIQEPKKDLVLEVKPVLRKPLQVKSVRKPIVKKKVAAPRKRSIKKRK